MSGHGYLQEDHPIDQFFYFCAVLVVTMFSDHPVFLGISFLGSLLVAMCAQKQQVLVYCLKVVLPFMLLMTVYNFLFSHNGATVLFYLNDHAMTMEAAIYGGVMAIRFGSSLLWAYSMQKVLTEDKILYLLSGLFPRLALTISMIFRYLPLICKRYDKVKMAQACMGRDLSKLSRVQRLRQKCKEISIVVAWSMESSIETGDSMEARGYGIQRRTSFHLFRFRRAHGMELALYLLLILGVLQAGRGGGLSMYYYPVVQWKGFTGQQIVGSICYLMLCLEPVIMESWTDYRWKKLEIRSTQEGREERWNQ